MLVKIGQYVITNQLSGAPVSYLSQQLGNCLIVVKRLFDKFIVSIVHTPYYMATDWLIVAPSFMFPTLCSTRGTSLGLASTAIIGTPVVGCLLPPGLVAFIVTRNATGRNGQIHSVSFLGKPQEANRWDENSEEQEMWNLAIRCEIRGWFAIFHLQIQCCQLAGTHRC